MDDLSNYMSIDSVNELLDKAVERAKIAGAKEFAEKLKKKYMGVHPEEYYLVKHSAQHFVFEIDELLKEMDCGVEEHEPEQPTTSVYENMYIDRSRR